MADFIYIAAFICIVFGVCSTASGFDIFGRQEIKWLTYGVMAFCLALVIIIVAGSCGVRL